jgi:nucleotide-binding universal stress UspA family protein
VFQNILVPVDGSAHAARALTEAVDLAGLSGASVTVMTVAADLPSWLFGGGPVDPATAEAVLRENQRVAESVLDQASAAVPDSLTVEKILGHGPPGRAIVEQVSAGGHDLVVMGSRGLGGVKSMLLGSVSQFVLQESGAAVLVVHAA